MSDSTSTLIPTPPIMEDFSSEKYCVLERFCFQEEDEEGVNQLYFKFFYSLEGAYEDWKEGINTCLSEALPGVVKVEIWVLKGIHAHPVEFLVDGRGSVVYKAEFTFSGL